LALKTDTKWALFVSIATARWEWEWDGNEVIKMGENWYEKSIPAHLYF